MVKYVVLVKRRPELDRETFRRRWQEEHLPLIRTLPGLRRVELNLATEVANYPPQFDGIGILWFDRSTDLAFQSSGANLRQYNFDIRRWGGACMFVASSRSNNDGSA
jgi:uncharacterized protein (TIGR02118 family)